MHGLVLVLDYNVYTTYIINNLIHIIGLKEIL